MNGTDILADTNAIIYFVNGNDCMKPYRNNCFNVSIISASPRYGNQCW